MPRKGSNRPTEVELEILGVLWDRGPSTVRQIHDILGAQKGTGYSTTLKMIQVMTEKGLLRKDDSQRPQVFTPAVDREEAQDGLLGDLVKRAFGGSFDKLVMRALESNQVESSEVDEIKKLIDDYQKGKK